MKPWISLETETEISLWHWRKQDFGPWSSKNTPDSPITACYKNNIQRSWKLKNHNLKGVYRWRCSIITFRATSLQTRARYETPKLHKHLLLIPVFLHVLTRNQFHDFEKPSPKRESFGWKVFPVELSPWHHRIRFYYFSPWKQTFGIKRRTAIVTKTLSATSFVSANFLYVHELRAYLSSNGGWVFLGGELHAS